MTECYDAIDGDPSDCAGEVTFWSASQPARCERHFEAAVERFYRAP